MSLTLLSSTSAGTPVGSLDYQWSLATVEPPTGNQIRGDNADPALVTKLWVRDVGNDTLDASRVLGLIHAGYLLYVQEWDNADNFYAYDVVGDAVDKTTYFELPVVWNRGFGTLPGQRCALLLIAPEVGSAPPVLGPDFVTVAEARSYVLRDAADTTQDTLFEVLIPAYSQAAQDYCDRTFVTENDATHTFAVIEGTTFISLTPYEVRPAGLTLTPELAYRGEPTHLSSLGTYLSLLLDSPVTAETVVDVTGDYGPVGLPAAVKLAVLKAIDNDYRNPSGHGTQSLGPYSYSETADVATDSTFSLPRASRNLLNPYRRWA